MAYGGIKFDNITFTNAGVDTNITVSGLYASTTSGLTVTGTISGNLVQGATVSGTTVTGTSANFASGVFTTQISGTIGIFGAGSATAPGLAVGVGTTYKPGIYSPGTDQLAISTGGTGRLFVDASGTVGIGVGSDLGASKFFIAGNGTAGLTNIFTLRTASGNSYGLQVKGNNTNDEWLIQNYYNAALAFGTNNTERMRLTSAGLLGLGTSAPNYQLHVTTSFAVGASGFNQQLSFTNDTIQSLILGTGYTALKLNPLGGNVGIGTSSPLKKTEIRSAPTTADTDGLRVSDGTRYMEFAQTGATYSYMQVGANQNLLYFSGSDLHVSTDGANAITLNTNALERARIDSSGRLLVGTSTSLDVNAGLQIAVNSSFSDFYPLQIFHFDSTNDASGPTTIYTRSKSDTVGTISAVNVDDGLGVILFRGAGTSNYVNGALIKAEVDAGTVSNTSMPTRLVFSTTADGAASPTERMRIDSSGNLGVGVTSPATASFGNVIRNKAPLGTGAAGYFTEGSNSDTWFGIYSGTGTSDSAALVYPSTGSLRIATTTGVGVGGFSERLRITSAGLVGVGTSTPTYKFQINSGSNPGGEAGAIAFGDVGPGTPCARINAYRVDGSFSGELQFFTTVGAGTETRAMTIDSSQRVLVGITSANTSGAKLQTSDGLTFPATQVASSDPNTLDDYEEGTFTPVIQGSTTVGTATYATRSGFYTKIGRQVTAHIAINWSSGTGTGNLQIGSLPFNTALADGSVSFGLVDNVTLTTLSILTGTAAVGSARIDLTNAIVGGGSYAFSPYDASGFLVLTVTYFAT